MKTRISTVTMDNQEYYLIGINDIGFLQRKSQNLASDNELGDQEIIINALCDDLLTKQTQTKAG